MYSRWAAKRSRTRASTLAHTSGGTSGAVSRAVAMRASRSSLTISGSLTNNRTRLFAGLDSANHVKMFEHHARRDAAPFPVVYSLLVAGPARQSEQFREGLIPPRSLDQSACRIFVHDAIKHHV